MFSPDGWWNVLLVWAFIAPAYEVIPERIENISGVHQVGRPTILRPAGAMLENLACAETTGDQLTVERADLRGVAIAAIRPVQPRVSQNSFTVEGIEERAAAWP